MFVDKVARQLMVPSGSNYYISHTCTAGYNCYTHMHNVMIEFEKVVHKLKFSVDHIDY